jgi:hypothetical protein
VKPLQAESGERLAPVELRHPERTPHNVMDGGQDPRMLIEAVERLARSDQPSHVSRAAFALRRRPVQTGAQVLEPGARGEAGEEKKPLLVQPLSFFARERGVGDAALAQDLLDREHRFKRRSRG